MTTITLYRGPNCWVADMSRAADADHIRAVMGTDQIPTPFSLQANPVDVITAVSRRNPLECITVRGATVQS